MNTSCHTSGKRVIRSAVKHYDTPLFGVFDGWAYCPACGVPAHVTLDPGALRTVYRYTKH